MPPALTRGGERLDGLAILEEVPGDLGLVLWRSARNVLLWAQTAPEQRGGLFSAAAAAARSGDLEQAEVEAELRAPLSVVVELLARPAEVNLVRLVNACRRVARWAEQRGALATALEFAQAAALASPDSPSLAYAVGRIARRQGEFDRAESWYTRAAVQARQGADWVIYASALLGIDNLHRQRGNYPAARRAALRCLRVAERHGLTEQVGAACHDLFAVASEMRVGFEADPLAQRALRAYGPGNPQLLRLAHDVAYHWIVQGFFAGALRVGRALVPSIHDPALRATALSLVARAAGGAGERDEFHAAAAEAQRLVEGGGSQEHTAQTLLGLAHGAMSLGEWEAARDWAAAALRCARAGREGRIALEAEAACEAAEHRLARPVSPAHPALPAAAELAEALAGAVALHPAAA